MNTKLIHTVSSAIGLAFIASFWTSSVIAELFLSQQAVATVKQVIVYAFILFIPAMLIAGISGNKLAANSSDPLMRAKRRRIPKIALNGLLVLLPCAFCLNHLAQAEQFSATFYAVQIMELIAGAANLAMMTQNVGDGFRLQTA